MARTQDDGKKAGPTQATPQSTVHASCVAVAGRGLLIIGASGSGKSGLALAMMACGADFVADDQVILSNTDNRLMASAVQAIDGLIEARGIGLLKVQPHRPVPVVCVLDLDQSETTRMPPLRRKTLIGHAVPLLFKCETPYFPAALMQYLKAGRQPES